MSHLTRTALAKAKVGGLVLAAVVLGTGTAQAVTGLTDDPASGDPVATASGDPVDPASDGAGDVADEPTEDPTGDATGEPSPDSTEDPALDPTTEPTCATEPTDQPTVEPTATSEPTAEVVEDPTVTSEPTCADDGTDEPVDPAVLACALAVNHGAYVSWVAHSTPKGPGHGAAVSEAARSDCGKKHADDGLEDPADDVTEPLATAPQPSGEPTRGHGWGKDKDKGATGHGHGWGKDKGATDRWSGGHPGKAAGHGRSDHGPKH